MAAPTHVYVDPAINANTGAGTIGSPWGDLQYALNTVTRDATNGNQFNIKAGTDEVLTAAISLTTYGTPTTTAPLILRGYTAAANDGGIGGISGAGSFSVFNSSTLAAIYFIDLHCHNTGAALVIRGGAVITIINCEINNSTGIGIQVAANCQIIRNHIHDIGAVGIQADGAGIVVDNFLKNGTKDFVNAIVASVANVAIENNVISVDGATNGISISNGNSQTITGNTIYSNGGTGSGIVIASSRRQVVAVNNIIEGFSGAGGKGLNLPTGTDLSIYGNNKYYNNTTNETLTGDIRNNLGNNAILLASPFTNPAGDDFSVSTAVKAGAYPSSFKGSSTNNYLDVGAAQRQEAAAAAGRISRIRGHGI